MIKTIYQKWGEIDEQVAEGKGNYVAAYYVSPKCPTPVYFASIGGCKGVFIEFETSELEKYKCPSIKGMNVSVKKEESINPNKIYLSIANNIEPDEVFLAFTNSLIDGIADSSTSFETIEVFERTIKEYKDYFSSPLLSLPEKEEQGLCAELLFLSEQISSKGDEVVARWLGPSKNKRDFVFDDFSVEIKSTGNQTHPSILVSNENQLDPTYPEDMKKLYLKVYVMERDESGFNVVTLANRIVNQLADINSRKIFLSKLLMDKVDPKIYLPRASFKTQEVKQYLIANTFPSLKKNKLPAEIFDVSYRLSIERLSDYENKESL